MMLGLKFALIRIARNVGAISAIALACTGDVAVAQAAAGHFLQVTPATSPALAAASTRHRTGKTTLVLVGFGDDLFDHDFVAGAGIRRIPTLWPTIGPERVANRVRAWMAAFRRAGGVADSVRSVGPSASKVSGLANGTWSRMKTLLEDSRAADLPGVATVVSRLRSVGADLRTRSLWAAAVAGHYRKADTRWVSEVASSALVAPSARVTATGVPAPSARTSLAEAPAPVEPQMSASVPSSVVSGSGNGQGATATTPGAPVSSARYARTEPTVTAAAATAALTRLTTRRQPGWQGELRYVKPSWDAAVIALKGDQSLRDELAWVIGESERVMALGNSLYRRPTSIDQIPSQYLVGGLEGLGPNAETRALAYFDCTQAHFLLKNGVTLALGAMATGRQQYIDRCVDMLRETATHDPLQRPGYTLASAAQVLPEGGDGVWLATASGIRGVIDMLDILGDSVPVDVQQSLRDLLRREIHRIVNDWNEMRPWFVKNRSANSNQWIEPTASLLLACQYVGDSALVPAYDLAVENLLQTLAMIGNDGAWREGVAYGASSMDAVFVALSSMSRSGDTRLEAMPYRSNAWRWLLQMHLPGGNLVNWGDTVLSKVPAWHMRTPFNSLSRAAADSGGVVALSQLKAIFPNGSDMGPGVMYASLIAGLNSAPLTSIDTYSHFPDANLVVWRSEWNVLDALGDRSLAIWVKGSSESEIHAHRDQGQVSVYRGSEPILLDCGVTNYGDPQYQSHFASAAGHGIMQIRALPPSGRGVDAPMVVHGLGTAGGDVSIDLAKGYSGVSQCSRRVSWSADGVVRILDRARFVTPVAGNSELFRLHTGCSESLAINGGGTSWQVSWSGATIDLESDVPIRVTQQVSPDGVRAPFMHRAIVITSIDFVQGVDLECSVHVAP